MNALALSPTEVRSAAVALRHQSARLGQVRGAVRVAGTGATGWSGLAAWEQQDRQESWCQAVDALCDPLDAVADLVNRFADQVDESQHAIRGWLARANEAAAEALDLRRLLVLADETVRPLLERRLADARARVDLARSRVAEEQDRIGVLAEQLADALSDSWPGRAVSELAWVVEVGRGLSRLSRAAVLALRTAAVVRTAVAAARAVTVEGRVVLLARAAAAAGLLRSSLVKGTGALRLVPRVPGPVGVILVTSLSGLDDVLTGGGYTGWRGTTTRVLGALAIPASVAVFSGTPPLMVGGGAILAAYGAWKGGNAVYDHRVQITRTAVRTYGLARSAAGLIDRRYRLSDRARGGVDRLRDLGDDIGERVTSGARATRDFVVEHLNPLPDPGEDLQLPLSIPTPIAGLRVPVTLDLPWGLPINPPVLPGLDDIRFLLPPVEDLLAPAPSAPWRGPVWP